MLALDLFVFALVVYLGLSAYAYRGTRVDGDRHGHKPAGPDTEELISIYDFFYSLIVLLFAGGCLIGGATLFVRGITGETGWVARAIGSSTAYPDTVPGALLFTLGVLMMLLIRHGILPAARRRRLRKPHHQPHHHIHHHLAP